MYRIAIAAAALLTISLMSAQADEPAANPLTKLESTHLANARQVTSGLPRAGEGYFSPDGKQIIYQAYPVGYPFYQIYTQSLDDNKTLRRVSPGRGRTTCSYFSIDGKSLLFASAHTNPNLPTLERDARIQTGKRRYEWSFDEFMDIYTCDLDGTKLKRLTDAPGYDAEGSYSSDGKQIVFTSTRDGDPDIFVMDADGDNLRQLTNVDGYDGGPFFSPDNQWVIFRSDRHKQHMLQIFMVSVDGKHEVQLTKNLNEVNWCPYFHPSGKYFIWSGADYSRGPRSAKFNLFAMELEYPAGKPVPGKITQITDSKAADVLPVFSPDGKQMMWTSTRNEAGTSQLWIADWKF